MDASRHPPELQQISARNTDGCEQLWYHHNITKIGITERNVSYDSRVEQRTGSTNMNSSTLGTAFSRSLSTGLLVATLAFTVGCDDQSSLDEYLDELGGGEAEPEPEPEPDAPPVDAGPPPPPDETGPVIELLTPTEDCLTGQITISFTALDDESGIGFVRGEFAGNNLTIEEPQPGQYEASFDVSNLVTAFHTMLIIAGDTSNNLSEVERVFGVAADGEYLMGSDYSCGVAPDAGAPPVDEDPPTASFLSPDANGGTLTSSTLSLSIQATDDVGPLTVTAECSGVTTELVGATDIFSGELSTASLAEGQHVVSVTATDAADRMTTITTTILVDHTLPSVMITEPQSGDTRVALTDVVAEASDSNGIQRVLLYESGNPDLLGLAATPSPGTTDVYGIIYQLPCTNLPRNTTFEMHAHDNAGNVAIATVSVTVTSEGCGE
jgi:hypothetical protein